MIDVLLLCNCRCSFFVRGFLVWISRWTAGFLPLPLTLQHRFVWKGGGGGGEGRGEGVSGRMDVTFVPGHVQVLIKCLFVRSLVINSDLEASGFT